MAPSTSGWWDERSHNVLQDEQYPQYGVIHKTSGFVVVDVKTRQSVVVNMYQDALESWPVYSGRRKEHYFAMAGVSEGKLGVWKYTQDYLGARCKEQGVELPGGITGHLTEGRTGTFDEICFDIYVWLNLMGFNKQKGIVLVDVYGKARQVDDTFDRRNKRSIDM